MMLDTDVNWQIATPFCLSKFHFLEEMLAILLMIAAVVIPLILFFLAPNPPPAQRTVRADASTNPRANANANADDNGAPSNSSGKVNKSSRRSEILPSELIALQTRLHINKVDATITISLHKQILNCLQDSSNNHNDFDGLDKVLSQLSEIGDVFVLVHCDNDEDEQEEANIRQTLGKLASYFQVYPHRVLFCASHIGKVAFLRQLKPLFHVEFHPKVYEDLRPHIPIMVLHRLSTNDAELQAAYAQYQKPYPNIIQHQISHLLTLTVKT